MQRALESALGELVHGPPLDPGDPAAVSAFFARHAVSERDQAALRGGELERLLIYRELVRGTLRDALEVAIPRSIARLGARFDDLFERFLAARGSASHYLRDVTAEFLDFARSSDAKADADPDGADVEAYIWDLARHEALHIEIAGGAREPVIDASPALELDARLRFIRALRLMHYAFAVHRLPEALDDRSVPERQATELLVYRSPEHEVRYLELTPLAASLLARLLSGATLRESVERAAEEHGARLDPPLLEATARLLADLSERGALLAAETVPTAESHSEPLRTEP